MHHVAIAFYDKQIPDFDTTSSSNTADIISAKIDEHQVLGSFFRIGQQLFFKGQILLQWKDPSANLAFNVAVHLGSLLAVLIFVWREIRDMLTAHKRGACVVAVFTKDVAETKATEGTEAGRRAGHPLQFSTEPEE